MGYGLLRPLICHICPLSIFGRFQTPKTSKKTPKKHLKIYLKWFWLVLYIHTFSFFLTQDFALLASLLRHGTHGTQNKMTHGLSKRGFVERKGRHGFSDTGGLSAIISIIFMDIVLSCFITIHQKHPMKITRKIPHKYRSSSPKKNYIYRGVSIFCHILPCFIAFLSHGFFFPVASVSSPKKSTQDRPKHIERSGPQRWWLATRCLRRRDNLGSWYQCVSIEEWPLDDSEKKQHFRNIMQYNTNNI